MDNSIHGHDVLRMMAESGKPYTRASLKKEIANTFGEDVLFHTGSAFNMTADDLIDFLGAHGKLLNLEGGFTTYSDKICDQ